MKNVYHRDTDDPNKVKLKSGYYTFIYDVKKLPENITPGKLPKVTHVLGKKAVIRDVRIDTADNKVYVDLWLAQNPIVIAYVIYIIGGALISWGLALSLGNLESIVAETFNPRNFIFIILIIVAVNIKAFAKVFNR